MTRVLMLPLPSCPASPRWGALERKRRLWWGDEKRNRAVASVATAVAAGDNVALLSLGLTLTPEELEAGRGAAAVLVESASHARALRDRLPAGWEVLAGLMEGDGGDAEEFDDVEAEEGAPPRRAVVTMARAWSAGLRTGALVRATGGRCPVYPDGPAGDEGLSLEATVLIDFLAGSDAGESEDTERRAWHYLTEGLEVVRSSRSHLETADTRAIPPQTRHTAHGGRMTRRRWGRGE